jgi:hypothetical protein
MKLLGPMGPFPRSKNAFEIRDLYIVGNKYGSIVNRRNNVLILQPSLHNTSYINLGCDYL